MLLSREEREFDFGAARFDLENPTDRRLLGWIFNQFLYGEITGIQCGYWLYNAPTLIAAQFLARQATEELSHVKRFLKILELIGENPAPPHRAIRFMATGMMGGSWGEHVTMEMALGEGLVLTLFYAMEQTISDPQVQKLITSALKEEESHVAFGERESQAWLEEHPGDRKLFLGQVLLQWWAMKVIKRFVLRKLIQISGSEHPVFRQFSEFYDHVIRVLETQVELLGISPFPLREMGVFEKVTLVGTLPVRKFLSKLRKRQKKLTTSYLEDPMVRNLGN